jgi:glycosyltransferase involved in cell wall biosynthesis
MSCIYKGSVIETTLSQNSRGGTEQMRDRLVKYADPEMLNNVAVHFSRPRKLYDDVPNILYLHDLATDPENKVLLNGGWKSFDCFVFVSSWQRDQYISAFGIPYSMCSVIHNAIELEYAPTEKQQDKINFIYHTTPHRGLELVYPIIDALSKQYDNIHLDVYSSFGVYGWSQRDKPYEGLFNKIREHSHMTYHGAKSNSEVLAALKEAHVFIYPSIWQETSCIAMIEAIRSGCVCIHPNYGALPETASGLTAMYNYTENLNENANRCYNITKSYLDLHKDFSYIFNLTSMNTGCALPRNSIQNFTDSWNNLLKGIINER